MTDAPLRRPWLGPLHFASWRDVPGDQWAAMGWTDFAPRELAVRDRPDRGAVLIVPEAVSALQRLRVRLSAPVHLTSAYRDPVYNARVGGAPRSKHTMGLAFDIRDSAAYDRDTLVAAAREAGFLGFGHYAAFLHVDLGRPREWTG